MRVNIGMPVVRTDSLSGGRSVYGHVITNFLGWVVYHIFLPMVLRRRASGARTPLKNKINDKIKRKTKHKSIAKPQARAQLVISLVKKTKKL